MLLFFILIIAILSGIAVLYNQLQRLAQPVKEKASNIKVAISKKLTMLNQLISVVKNYQEAEQFTQLKIAQDSNDTASLIASYQQSGNLLTSIQGVAEKFPNLKASEQYQRLMLSIQECENGIQSARESYNSTVREYNSKRSSIPTVFVAQLIGFSEAPYLQFDVSGNDGDNILKDFKTDDGERLQMLLKNAGSKIGDATKSLAHHAESARNKLVSPKKDTQLTEFYYLLPGGVPKGPLPLKEIRQLIRTGSIPQEIKLAEKGSDDWKDITAVQVAEPDFAHQ